MDSPRSGFRWAAVTSWALAGIGVAGVAGASALAYGDTVKPAPVATPAVDTVATDPVVGLPPPSPVETTPPPAPAVEMTPPPAPAVETTPPPIPEPTVTRAPVEVDTPAATPKPVSTPKPVQQQAPAAPSTKSQSAFPIRQSHVPLSGGGASGGNSFSPHVTISRGS